MANAFSDSRKPSEVTDDYFIFHFDEVATAEFGAYPSEKCGKWMMFFPKGPVLDEKWALAVSKFSAGMLTGIHQMKVSTARENPRANNSATGIIIFYCGPCDDEALMMGYGQNLLTEMDYRNSFGFMYYKSDEQTDGGTRATGQKKNSLYRLACPKH